MNRKTYGVALLAAAALALVLAACGGGGSSTSSDTSSEAGGGTAENGKSVKAAPNAEKGTTFVSLGNVSGVGMVLVDSEGKTLYDFAKDNGTESACYGECAEAWPPLIAKGEPQPSNGASASQLGTTERKDGSMQVTYAGHPLYGFVGDKGPGEANGNGVEAFGGKWFALEGSGEEAAGGGEEEAVAPVGGGY